MKQLANCTTRICSLTSLTILSHLMYLTLKRMKIYLMSPFKGKLSMWIIPLTGTKKQTQRLLLKNPQKRKEFSERTLDKQTLYKLGTQQIFYQKVLKSHSQKCRNFSSKFLWNRLTQIESIFHIKLTNEQKTFLS